MASNINPYSIDGTFPTAGQDNPSQGFRDNFTNIKNNLIFTKNELDDLMAKAIVSTPLAGQTLTNNMAGTQITAPQLKAWTQAILDLGVVSTVATLDFSQGNFQKVTTAASISLDFTNWPASTGAGSVGYGAMRVWFSVTNNAHTIHLPTNVDIGVADIAGYNATSNTITFDAAGDYVFEFSSVNSGQDYLIFDLTRGRASFRDPNLYYNPEVNSTFLIGFGDGFQTVLAFEQGQDTIAALGSYNAVAIGDLSQGNVASPQLASGPLGGYSTTAARGNITTGTVTAVRSNDLIGYFNAAHYTGYSNTGNTFQQAASIDFYSTGSNVTYGLGGNIAFYTTRDGEGNSNYAVQTLRQAMSINNDQSVQAMGRFRTDSGLIEAGTIVTSLATSNPPAFTANANISTLIVDSVSSTTINLATIILPSSPTAYQTITIAAVAPITSCNIWAPASATVKYVPTNFFSTGNARVKLTYFSGSWYRN
jgi:hypothetical protein